MSLLFICSAHPVSCGSSAFRSEREAFTNKSVVISALYYTSRAMGLFPRPCYDTPMYVICALYFFQHHLVVQASDEIVNIFFCPVSQLIVVSVALWTLDDGECSRACRKNVCVSLLSFGAELHR